MPHHCPLCSHFRILKCKSVLLHFIGQFIWERELIYIWCREVNQKVMPLLGTQISQILGIVYSVVGILFMVLTVFLLKTYLRFLDFLQILFILSLALGSRAQNIEQIFSSQLEWSCMAFPITLFEFCVKGDLVCTAAFQISFGGCLVLFLLAMRAIVAIEQWRRNLQYAYLPFYNFFKGVFRWVYLAICYYSMYFLWLTIIGEKDSLPSSIVLILFCLAFPVAQLLYIRHAQSPADNIWEKWLEFASYYRLLLIGFLIAIGQTVDLIYILYGINLPCLIYLGLYTWKNPFTYRIAGRVVYVIGELLVLATLNIFVAVISVIEDYNIDLFAASLLLLIDICHHIAQFCVMKGFVILDYEDTLLNPEDSLFQKIRKKRSERKDKVSRDTGQMSRVSRKARKTKKDLNVSEADLKQARENDPDPAIPEPHTSDYIEINLENSK